MRELVALRQIITVRRYRTAKGHVDRGVFKSFYREAVTMTATHVRNGVVSGPADFGWDGPLRAHKQTKLGNDEKVLSQGAIGTSPDIDQPSGRP
jgi:hypothetical protein